MNYVTTLHIGSILIGILLFAFGVIHIPSAVSVSLMLAYVLLLIMAGYMQQQKGKAVRSVLWVGIVNFLLFFMAWVFDEFGKNFSFFGSSNSESFLFTLCFWAYNAWYFPLFELFESEEFFPNLLPVLVTFFIPLGGYQYSRSRMR